MLGGGPSPDLGMTRGWKPDSGSAFSVLEGPSFLRGWIRGLLPGLSRAQLLCRTQRVKVVRVCAEILGFAGEILLNTEAHLNGPSRFFHF